MRTYYVLTTRSRDFTRPNSDFMFMNCFQSEESAIAAMHKAFIEFLGITYDGDIKEYMNNPRHPSQRVRKHEAQATRGLRMKKWTITKKEIDYENLLTHYIIP